MANAHSTCARFGRWIATLVLLSLPCASLAKPVENFVLLDQNGNAHELYYHRDASAIVIMVHGNGCALVRAALPDFNALRKSYEPTGVKFFMLNSNLQDNRKSIATEAAEWGIDVPILDDNAQIIGPSLQLTRTAEVLVINPKSWEIIYRGPLDDRLSYERQKTAATHNYVLDTLDALAAEDSPDYLAVNSPGCLINFPSLEAAADISYSETIAPLLENNCVACHRSGGIGPWAMTDYTMIKGFSPMIREVVRTRRMPPWHLDPEIGTWLEDHRLSETDTSTLVRWIEAGSPRGEGPDPLLAVAPLSDAWPLGEPDLILKAPAFEVPASGVVDYQFPVVSNPLDVGVWVVAATVMPGDRKVVHHVLVGAARATTVAEDEDAVFENYIMGYAPGNESAWMPAGTGVYIPPGGNYLFQMHYTPIGKASTDRTRLGLYFAKQTPANFVRHQVVIDPALRIPAGAEAYQAAAYFPFYDDALLYSLTPHAHYRGSSSLFELEYPNGEKEVLLSTPVYDFNWQRTYTLAEPKAIPAGSRLVHRTTYNNSAKNTGNPDPNREVPWGLQSSDEMLYGAFSFSWTHESSALVIHDPLKFKTAHYMGFMDRDMDSRVSFAELYPGLQRRVGENFAQLDQNGDGGLDLAELQHLIGQLSPIED